MASSTLSIVGFSLFGPVGGLVGGLLGAYLDQMLFFKPETQEHEGPKLDEISLQTSSEGAKQAWILGENNRIAGNVIWLGPLDIKRRSERVGGKDDGGGERVTTYHHYTDVMIAVADNLDVETSDPIEEIRANGQLFWQPDITVSDTGSSNFDVAVETWYGIMGFISVMQITAPYPTFDFAAKFRTGFDVTTTGFANGANNGTWNCEYLWDNGVDETYMLIRNANAVTESNASATASQVQIRYDPTEIETVTIYTGGASQQPESEIEKHGILPVPAYRDQICVFLDQLYLDAFGGVMPHFSFKVNAKTDETVGEAITKICERNGLTASDIDVSTISTHPGDELLGIVGAGLMSGIDMLRPLMMAYNIAVRESNGQLIFYQRGVDEDEVTITDGDLAAREEGTNAPQIIDINDPATIDLPTEIIINFIDTTHRLERGCQRHRVLMGPNRKTMTLDLPITMTPATARSIAARVAWSARIERQKPVRVTLPPSYIEVEEGDRIVCTAEGETFNIIVKKIDEAAIHWLREIEGFIEETETQQLDGSGGDDPIVDVEEPYYPPTCALFMTDAHPYLDAHTTITGAYWNVCASDINALWKGAVLFSSEDDTNFERIAVMAFETTAGQTTTALGDAPVEYWDNVSTVRVQLYHGTLSSVTALEVLGGANHAMVGDEVIGFTTATLVSGSTYDLSGFIRGRRDTGDETGGHVADERFILLDTVSTFFEELSLSKLNSTRYYKIVPVGAVEGDATSTSTTIQGYSVRTFSPAGVQDTVDMDSGSGTYQDITVNWVRRSRARWRFFNFAAVPPLIEPTETYRIQVMDGAAVKNTYTVSSVTTWTYTQAQQVADWTSVQASYTVRISQLSATLGYGKYVAATLTGSP